MHRHRALLFQTGYLTIRRTTQLLGRQHYELGYPNEEVRRSLNLMMLNALTGDEQDTEKLATALLDALATGDPGKLRMVLTAVYAAMPHQQYRGGIDRIEGHYVQLLLAAAHMLGPRAVAEDSSARGRSDVALFAGDRLHEFEFKMQGAGDPLAQALEQGYADKYAHFGDRAQVVGVAIDPTTRSGAEPRTAQPFQKGGRLDEGQSAGP